MAGHKYQVKTDSQHHSDQGQLWTPAATSTEGLQAGWETLPDWEGFRGGPGARCHEELKTFHEKTKLRKRPRCHRRASPGHHVRKAREQRRGARRSRTSRGRGSHSGLRSAGEGTAFSTASPSRAPPTTAAEPAAHRKPLRSAAQAHRATPPRPGLGPDGTCPLGWGASGETSSSLLRGSLPA